MSRYGLPNNDQTAIIQWKNIDDGGSIRSSSGQLIANPKVVDYEEAGWVIQVDPVVGVHEYLGDLVITDTTVTRKVLPWTQEMLDDETSGLADL